MRLLCPSLANNPSSTPTISRMHVTFLKAMPCAAKLIKGRTSILDALIHISEREISLRNHRAAQIQVSVSHFPYIKTLEEFDYHFQPSVNKTEIRDFGTLRFLEHKENILFYGTPGTGKTHLATAMGCDKDGWSFIQNKKLL